MLNPWLIGAGIVGLGYWFTKKKPLQYQDGPFAVNLIPGPAGVVWMLGLNGAIAAQGTEANDALAREAAHAKAISMAKAMGK